MSAVSIEHPIPANKHFRVFALCLDSAAAERARWLARQLGRHETHRRELVPQIWKLDSILTAGSLGNLLAQDAAESDLLVVAISSLDHREPALVDWLKSLAPLKQTCRRGGLLVGLFGDEGHPAGELAWLVTELGDFARQTGMRFLWQWMADGAMQDTSWLEEGIAELSAPGCSPNTIPPVEMSTNSARLAQPS